MSRSYALPRSAVTGGRAAAGRALLLFGSLGGAVLLGACRGGSVALHFPPAQGKVLSTLDSACAQASRTKNAARSQALSQAALGIAGPLLSDATNGGWVARLGRVDRLGTEQYVVSLLMGRASVVDTIAATHPVIQSLAAVEVGAPLRVGIEGLRFADPAVHALLHPVSRPAAAASAPSAPGFAVPSGGFGKAGGLKDAVCQQRLVGAVRVLREDSTAVPTPQ